MSFLNDIKASLDAGNPYFIAYYGASTVSHEHVFPRWSEIIQYVLKDYFEEKLRDYKSAYWNLQSGNFGLSGATSTEIRNLLDSHVVSRKPQMIFLMMGKNDAYLGIDKKETENNINSTIRLLLDKGAKVIMANTIPSSREDLNKKVKDYIEVEQKVGLSFKENPNFMFVDLFNLFPRKNINEAYSLIEIEDNDDVGFSAGEIDPIHYNKLGNALVAKIFLKEVFGIDFNESIFLRDINDDTIKYPNY